MEAGSRQTDVQIAVNKDLATAAKDQAEAARQGAAVARDNMIASERAWVGPSDASIIGGVKENTPIVVNIAIFNSGREPAKNFSQSIQIMTATGDSTMLLMDMKDYVVQCFARVAGSQAQVIYPTVGFGAGGVSFQETLSADKVDANIISGNTYVIVRGCLTYQTIGATKHSSFCFFYKGGTTKPEHLNICANGSDAE